MIDVRAPLQRCRAHFLGYWAEKGWPLPVDSVGQPVAYIAAGNPADIAVDGEGLVFALAGIAPGRTGTRGAQSRGVGSVTVPEASFMVRLMRYVPILDSDMSAPAPEEIEAAALELLADPGRILDTLLAWRQSEPLAVSHNATAEVGRVEPHGPQGGFAGHGAVITLSPVQ